ncbi:hypothetical protein SMX70_004547 [Cronobacter sakazakii]|nr:hypothetical protein [Cronobacter sakazakii]ELY5952387.1 hypothetical protein [Cronobacter sakazakii]
MSKATKTGVLWSAAHTEFICRFKSYWQSSSLTSEEKKKYLRPSKPYRRDRVMNAILRRDISRKMEVARNEIIASIGGKKS